MAPASDPAIAEKSSSSSQSFFQRILLGNRPTPELMAILLVYFVQGILGLSRLAVSFFLKDDLALSPAEVAALTGVAGLPWMVKPLFGFLSDGLPILGYRRRSYLVLAGLLGSGSWVALATVIHSAWAATLAIALSSLSVAVSDVIVDSLVVERARGESVAQTGSLQSICWGTSAIGGLLTAYLSGALLERFNVQTVFLMTSSFPLLVAGAALLISEQRRSLQPDWSSVKSQVGLLRQAVSKKAIWLPTLFLFLWQATPSADSAFFYFSTNELGFGPEFLGRVRLVTSIAMLLGIWAFNRFFKTVPFRRIFAWGIVISTVLGLSTLLLVTHTNRIIGISDRWFSLGDSLVLTVAGEIAFMPVLVLAARLCPPGVEATLFALLMSVLNLSSAVSQEFGAILTHWLGVTESNFDNLWLLVTITSLSTLLPLPFVGWLPDASADDGDESGDRPNGLPPEITVANSQESLSMVSSLVPDMLPEPESQKS
ncbi:MAG: folate/biopterin family MFS transporter [Cyanophyceae cyanobacterium]